MQKRVVAKPRELILIAAPFQEDLHVADPVILVLQRDKERRINHQLTFKLDVVLD